MFRSKDNEKKQSLGYLTNAVMIGLEKDFLENKPNLVIVQEILQLHLQLL